jgi:hypothetical protein
LRKLGGAASDAYPHHAASVVWAREKTMQAYAMTFAGCAICSLIFVYDTTPNVLKVGKAAVAIFTLLFIGSEILALVT